MKIAKSLAVALIALSLGAVTAQAAVPAFTTTLTNKAVAVGANFTFSVASTNASVEAWYYQYTNVIGGSSFTYNIPSVAKSNAGVYTVVITNASGSAIGISTLTVLVAPAITSQPISAVTVPVGTITNLTVGADGDSLVWQWFKDNKAVPGANTTTLSLANLKTTDSGQYWAVATNLVGKVTSSTNTLTVVAPPTISTQPKSQALLVGQNLNLMVAAKGTGTGTNLTYQWLLAGTNISGASTNNYSITNVSAASAGDFSVVVTANSIASMTSAVAKITVAADTKAPVFAVTFPKTVTNTSYTLTGKTKDDVAVTNLTYTLTGTNFTAITSTNGWASWSANITFNIGSNTLSLIATDYSGNATTNTASIFCAPFYNVTFTTNGSGSGSVVGVTSKMQYAGVYSLTAKPNPKSLFMYWTISGVSTNSATNASKITFTVTNDVTVAATFGTNMFISEAGQYNGLFYPTGTISHSSVGFLSASITTNLAYSGKVLIHGSSIGISGQLDTNGVGSATLDTNGTSLQFGLSGGQQLTGTVSSVNWTSILTADLAVFSKTNTQSNFAGTFTIAIPPGTNGPATNGYGYGVVTVDASGIVKLVGAAADGTTLAQSVPISQDGYWPLFVPLYPASKTNTTGELFGWIQFPTNGAPSGTVFWDKAPDSATIYGSGLTNIVDIISSTFTAPSKTSPKPLNGLVFGINSFTGGNLTNTLSDWVFMGGNGSVYCYDENTSMKVSPTGLVNGKFLHNGTGKSIPFAGVVMQNHTNAFGYFLGTNSAGSMTLVPYP